MSQAFHKRFNIRISEKAARTKFINRVHNDIWGTFLGQFHRYDNYSVANRAVLSHLGKKYGRNCDRIHEAVGDNFLENLHAIEGLYDFLRGDQLQEELDNLVTEILAKSEIDLGIRWDHGHFLSVGAPLLDEKAVNDVLGLMNTPKHKGVDQAFRTGLDLFLHSTKKPELLSDVATRMHESLEALAMVVCKNSKILSANQEALVSTLQLSDHFKRMLREYIRWANDFHRHAGEKGQAKPLPSRREVEAFIYFTGLFIRLALS